MSSDDENSYNSVELPSASHANLPSALRSYVALYENINDKGFSPLGQEKRTTRIEQQYLQGIMAINGKEIVTLSYNVLSREEYNIVGLIKPEDNMESIT